MLSNANFKAILAACGLIGLGTPSHAFPGMNYPTKWEVQNQSGSPINLSCEGEAMGLGVIKDLRSLVGGAGGNATYTWSNWYYNDGLGLNAGTWFCRDNASNTVLDRFSTDWGDNVTLVIKKSGSRLTVSKY